MRLPGKGMSWKTFVKELKSEYKKDRIGDTAGALTFFGVLALFPFLLFLVSLASVIIDPGQAEALIAKFSTAVPEQVKAILIDRVRQLAQEENVGLLSVGALAAIWAASSGMVACSRALNIVYDVEEGRGFINVRLRAILMTVVVSALAIVAAVLVVAAPSLADGLPGPLPMVVKLLSYPVAGVIMMLVWALIYYVLPDVEQKFKFITPGSVGGVLLWLIASFGFNLYVSNFGKYDATHGALGGVVVLLLWMWISGQVLLIGAEANSIIEHYSPEGKRQGAKSMNDTGTTPTPQARLKDAAAEGRPAVPPHHVVVPEHHTMVPEHQRLSKKKRPLKTALVGLAAAFASEKLGKKKGDPHVH